MKHNHLKRIPIFLASPSDLGEERKLFYQIIERVNELIAKPKGILLEAIIWEDTLIGKGRPQEKINEDLELCDLVVMLLWKKWGSPTGKHSSGFEEEYKVADANGKEIWMYFREVPEDMIIDPGKQLEKVIEFKNKIIEQKKYLCSNYRDENKWENIFFDHLSKWLNRMRSESSSIALETGQKNEKPIKSSQNIQEINKKVIYSNKEKTIEKEIQIEGINNPRILIGNYEVPYLKIESEDYLGCTLFADSFGFSNGTYNFHCPQESYVSLKKLEDILRKFYIDFRTGYEFDNPSFIINQTCSESKVNYSWYGFGLKNFVQSLKDQRKRYSEAEIIQPHHREVASFVARGPSFIFYIGFQPDVIIKKSDELNFDYMQVGFIFGEIPFNNRKFIDFYKELGLIEPDFIYNEEESLNVEVVDLTNKKFNLERKGFMVYSSFGEDWVSKVIFENPFYENKNFNEYLSQHKRIVVNLIDHHPLKLEKNYFLKELRIIPIPYFNFGFTLLKILGNW